MPPPEERRLGMEAYLTTNPGVGGRLRAEPEDFVVVELGDGPRRADGAYTAARLRLRNWETNRFARIAARRIGIKPGQVGFAGMKDKRAVTEQWFTFKAPEERVARIQQLDDVEVLEYRPCAERQYAGAHDGNRFVLRVRDAHSDRAQVEAVAQRIRLEDGVPRYFGPQRFGGGVRATTHLVGAAIVAGELEEAVRLYLGNPVEGERHEAYEARRIYEDTRDPAAALEAYPHALDPERRMLERLVRRPRDWRYCLQALPGNLLQLFVHAHQSWIYNHILSARLAEGWGLRQVRAGDRVCGLEEDGTATHVVTAWNLPRVQREVDQGRAAATAPLPGLGVPLSDGEPGDLERAALERLGVETAAFRCRELPQVASEGRRRTVLQPVRDLEVAWTDGDPLVTFALGKGDYATTVLREFMKTTPDAY